MTDANGNTVATPTIAYYQVIGTTSTLLSGAPASAGTYLATASYGGASATVNFAIRPATPIVTAAADSTTYTGAALAYPGADVAVAGANNLGNSGGALSFTYNGSATVPTAAGNYTVVVAFTPIDTTDFSSATVSTLWTISKATPTLTVTDTGGAYSGSAFAATAQVAGLDNHAAASLEGVMPTLDYQQLDSQGHVSADLGSQAPSSSGSYQVVATFAGSTDYLGASASALFSIGQATPTLAVSDPSGNYTGQRYAATTIVSGQPASNLEGVGVVLDYQQGNTDLGNQAPFSPGSYQVFATFAGSTDYAAANASTAFTIAQTTPVVSVSAASGPYNGQPFAATATVTGASGQPAANLESLGVALDYQQLDGNGNVHADLGAQAPAAAGSYRVVATYAGTADFTSASSSATFAVSPASLLISVANQTMVYGAAMPALTVSYSGFVGGDTAASLTTAPTPATAAANSPAGSYAITASGAVDGNYSITYVAGVLTIAPAPLTIAADNQTAYYGSGLPALTASYTGLVNGDTPASLTAQPTLTTTATASSPPATPPYSITASGAVDSNYTITYKTGTLTVLPPPLVITAVSQTMVYGSALPALTVSFSGFANGDTPANLTAPPNVTTTATAGSSVGTYPILISGAVDGDYTISYVAGTLTITPAPLTISALPQTQVYGTAAPPATITFSGFVNGDTPASSFTTAPVQQGSTKPNSAAGNNYAIPVGGAVAPNYTITYQVGHVTVAPATPTLSVTDAGGTYNGAAYAVTAASVTGVAGDGALASLTAHVGTLSFTYYIVGANNSLTALTGAPMNAGRYEVFANYASDNPNYTNASGVADFTIGKAALTVTANDASKTYGGADPVLTYTVHGTFYNGDTAAVISGVSLATTTGAAATAGTHTITATGGTAANYAITDVNGVLTVNQAALTVTADAKSKTYGGADPTLTYTPSGTLYYTDSYAVISGVTLSTATGAAASAGAHTITATGGTAANYAITDVNGVLTVSQAALTVTANNQSKTYGGADPTLSYTPSGTLYYTDTYAVISGVSLATTTSGAAKRRHAHHHRHGAAAAANYAITYATGVLTVNKATLTVTANAATKVFDSANPTFSDTITGFVAGDSSSVVSGTASLTTTATSPSPVGSYPIIAALGTLSAANYSFTFVPGTLTITLTPTSGSAVYLLNSSAASALSLSGNAHLAVSAVDVDSNSASAISTSGNAIVTAGSIAVVGKVQSSGNAHFSTTPVTGATSIGDPLANLPVPTVSGTASSVNLGGNSTLTIYPGIYNKIQVSGNAVLTLSPGIYVIAGGGVNVSGNAILQGTGVMLYNGGAGYSVNNGSASDGGAYGAINFSGNAQMNITPATTGAYAGILIFQARQNTNPLSLSGNADPSGTSVVYAPAAAVTLSGNAQIGLQTTLIASTLTLSGNSIFQLTAPSDGLTVYSPAQIRTAYGISSLALDGTGQTIAIVDAYDDPAIYQALDAFDVQFGITTSGPSLFQQYGPASSFLSVINQQGDPSNLPSADPTGAGVSNWEMEEALDVEWVHSIAPGAKIILVEANSQSLADLMTGVQTAAQQPGVSVVSMSWGFAENQAVTAADEALYDSYLTTPAGHQGVTFVASTGDFGSADPEYPAFSPNVVAVGGTSLLLNADNSYNSESAWGAYVGAVGSGQFLGSGGGLSQFEAEPAWQMAVQSTNSRTTPDVSMVADPTTGAWIADTYNLPSSDPFAVVGGTSLSAPSWAGLVLLADQGRVAAGAATLGTNGPTETQQAIYGLPVSDFNQITTGASDAFSAGAGYNLVTGLGTPEANLLVPDLIAYSGSPFAGSQRSVTITLDSIGQANAALDGANPVNVVSPINVVGIFNAEFVAAPALGLGWNLSRAAAAASAEALKPASQALPAAPTGSTPLVAKPGETSKTPGPALTVAVPFSQAEFAAVFVNANTLPADGAASFAPLTTTFALGNPPSLASTFAILFAAPTSPSVPAGVFTSTNVAPLFGTQNASAGDLPSLVSNGAGPPSYGVQIGGALSNILIGGAGNDLQIGGRGDNLLLGGFQAEDAVPSFDAGSSCEQALLTAVARWVETEGAAAAPSAPWCFGSGSSLSCLPRRVPSRPTGRTIKGRIRQGRRSNSAGRNRRCRPGGSWQHAVSKQKIRARLR